MNTHEWRVKLRDWDFPLGPFREWESVLQEMKQEAEALGTEAATEGYHERTMEISHHYRAR